MESYLKAEISASAVRHNVGLLRERIGAGRKICGVVKADCYGHGLATLLGLLSELVDCLGVTTPQEAMELRQLGYERPIVMFFSACAHAEGKEMREVLGELIAADVTLTVVAAAEVRAVAEVARRVGRPAEVHVKIDTGMGRSGVLPEAAVDLIAQARRTEGVRLGGLYTHFATADEADKTFTRQQLDCFLQTVEAAGGRGGLTLHAANSAATIDLPETHLDMVRPGIAMYGYQPSEAMHNRLPLRPALRLTGRLMQMKVLPKGSRCGYGLTHRFPRDTVVGLVPVGYADGYMRCLSNQSTMQVRGREVPICGRVAMDQVIVDLTRAAEARVGDEVEIISREPGAPHSVEAIARVGCTIPYEITCRIGHRARRVLVD